MWRDLWTSNQPKYGPVLTKQGKMDTRSTRINIDQDPHTLEPCSLLCRWKIQGQLVIFMASIQCFGGYLWMVPVCR